MTGRSPIRGVTSGRVIRLDGDGQPTGDVYEWGPAGPVTIEPGPYLPLDGGRPAWFEEVVDLVDIRAGLVQAEMDTSRRTRLLMAYGPVAVAAYDLQVTWFRARRRSRGGPTGVPPGVFPAVLGALRELVGPVPVRWFMVPDEEISAQG